MYLYSWPLFHIWRIAGVAPILRKKLTKGDYEYVVSARLIVYGLCLVGILLASSLYPLYLEVNHILVIRMKTPTAIVGCISDNISLMLCGIVGVLANSWYCNSILQMMEKVRDIDKTLGYTRKDNRFSKFAMYYFIALNLQTSLDIINWYRINTNSLYYMPSYLFHHMIFTIEFEYIDIVLQIKNRFILLNTLFKQNLMMRRNFDVGTQSLLHGKPGRISGNGNNVKPVSTLTNIHWLLCDVIKNVNETFGFQMLMVMLSILIHIVITPYFFLLGIAYPSTNSDKNTEYLLLQGTWTVFHIIQLITITWSCSTSTEKANQTAPLLCKYLLHCYSEDMLKEMEGCVIQLMHHGTTYSACGLFDLNLPLITAVSGAVTTYLVILIQFQNADG